MPRFRLVSAPYAMVSGQVITLSEQNVQQFWLLVQSKTDADGDGYEKLSVGGSDCNDLDYDVNPGAVEDPAGTTCGDGKNNDCDGVIDDGFT